MTDFSSDSDVGDSPRLRLGLGLLSVALVAIPFLVVDVPLAADLPQHVAQLRLLGEALGSGADIYRVHWFAPNNLVYAVLGALWPFFSPLEVGRVGLLLVAVAWVSATHALAAMNRRPALAATVASVLVFNGSLYWGFMNFLVGWPMFVVWIWVTTRDERSKVRHVLGIGLGALGLYSAHVLWLLAGFVWLGIETLLRRRPTRDWVLRGVGLLPILVAVAIWYPQFLATRKAFGAAATWIVPIAHRFTGTQLVERTLGGLVSPVQTIVVIGILIWIGATLARGLSRLRTAVDPSLLVMGCAVAVFAFVAPDKAMNTIHFAQRWVPISVGLLLLSLPPPPLPMVANLIGAGLILSTLTLGTAVIWNEVGATETAGLQAAVLRAPVNARILGLDIMSPSRWIAGRPYLHQMAWIQAEKGGLINFSFVEHGSSLVGLKRPRVYTHPPGIEWYPGRARPEDLLQYDFVLVNGDSATHARMATDIGLIELGHEGRFRLYQVKNPVPRAVTDRGWGRAQGDL